jgi:TPR repeat protein
MHAELQRILNKFAHSKEISHQDWNDFLNTRSKLGEQANLDALTLLLHLADSLHTLPEEAHLDIYLMLLRLSPEHRILIKKDLINIYAIQFDELYHASPNQPKTTKQISAYITKIMLFHETLATHRRNPNEESELFKRCLTLCRQQFSNGYLDYCLGWMHYYGIGTAINVRFAMSFFNQATEKQCTTAAYCLALCFEESAESTDIDQRVDYLLAAAKRGNPESQFLYAENRHRRGLKLRNGDSEKAKTKFQEAITWCEKSAYQGHPEAQYELGHYYDNKAGGKKDPSKAIHWYAQAGEQGHIDAINRLAFLYSHGRDVAQDLDKAIELYQRGVALEDGRAIFGLMKVYLSILPSESKAIELFETLTQYNGHAEAEQRLKQYATNSRSAAALFAIGNLYDRKKYVHSDDRLLNNRPSFRTDNDRKRESGAEEQMVDWYKEAADQGHAEAKSRLAAYHQKQVQVMAQFYKAVTLNPNASSQNQNDQTPKKDDEATIAPSITSSSGMKM